jgi:hypothetical protein
MDPYENKQFTWENSVKKGNNLEFAIGLTLWIRYCIIILENDSLKKGDKIFLKEICFLDNISPLLENLKFGWKGIVKLTKKFIGTKESFNNIHEFRIKFLTINGDQAPYADLISYALNHTKKFEEKDYNKQIGFQAKNVKGDVDFYE